MWVQKRLDRARRRFRAAPEPPIAPEPDALDDVAVSLVRSELERLIGALAVTLGPDTPRPDSPALLAGALATAIGRAGGRGKPAVTRSPAGLYSPEYWHIRVEGADSRTRDAIGRLTAGGRIG